jgi:hypothetical protein
MHTWTQCNIVQCLGSRLISTTLQFSVPFGESSCMLSVSACAPSCMGESVKSHGLDSCQFNCECRAIRLKTPVFDSL